MGTSKSNSGLGSGIPLLPSWAPPPGEITGPPTTSKKPGVVIPNEILLGNWSSAKRALTTVTKSSNNVERTRKIRRAAKAYISGSGNARGLSNSSRGGRSVASNLGQVLFSIATVGIADALTNLDIDIKGSSTEVIFARLAQELSTKGGTIEESTANVALIDALSYLYEQFDLEDKDVTNLDSLSIEDAKSVIQVYISSYIFERWLHELGIKIEKSQLSESQIIKLEQEIRAFIESSVKLDFGAKDLTRMDFSKDEGKTLVEEIFFKAYQMIEDL